MKMMNRFLSKLFRNSFLIEVNDKCNGGSTRIGDLQITYGFANQVHLVSPYAGRQCTSIALTAIIFWYSTGYCDQFSARDINSILIVGNQLHTRLRSSRHFSSVNDGMVGLSDIPHNGWISLGKIFGQRLAVGLETESLPVFTSKSGAQAGLQSLEEYISYYQPDDQHVGFIITIDIYSYAVLRCSDRQYALFDSHGHLRLHQKTIVDRGMVITFPTLRTLIGMLQNLYGLFSLCDIAPVACQNLGARPNTEWTNMTKTARTTKLENDPSINTVHDSKSPIKVKKDKPVTNTENHKTPETTMPNNSEIPVYKETTMPKNTEIPVHEETTMPNSTEIPVYTETTMPNNTEIPVYTETTMPNNTEIPVNTETTMPNNTEHHKRDKNVKQEHKSTKIEQNQTMTPNTETEDMNKSKAIYTCLIEEDLNDCSPFVSFMGGC